MYKIMNAYMSKVQLQTGPELQQRLCDIVNSIKEIKSFSVTEHFKQFAIRFLWIARRQFFMNCRGRLQVRIRPFMYALTRADVYGTGSLHVRKISRVSTAILYSVNLMHEKKTDSIF
jgi:hypothetical protein